MKIRLLSALVLATSAPMAMAINTASGTLTVNGTVVDSCTVQNQTLSFAGYNPVADSGNTAQADISVTCSNGTAYTIGLDNGQNFSSSQRHMSDGTNSLAYGLYSDATHLSAWGDPDSSGGTGSGSGQTYTVYGLIPTQANAVVSAGYTDTVTINVYY